MARPSFVRGQLPVVPAGLDRWKKQTQSNPLKVKLLESIRYTVYEKSKPIDVNCHWFNHLRGKKVGFSRNMNGAMGSQVPIQEQWRVASG